VLVLVCRDLPERYADVVDSVVDFLDGLYANRGAHWEPTKRRWEQ
jgi:hypothetical protein